jgi:hypothetical protein
MVKETPNDRFKTWRQLKAIRRAEIADIFKNSGKNIGSSYQAVKDIEDNNRNLTTDHLEILRNTFRLNPDWVISGEGEMLLSEDHILNEPSGTYIAGRKDLSALLEEVCEALPHDKKEICDRLKTTIHDVIEDRDKLQERHNQMMEVLSKIAGKFSVNLPPSK